MVADVFRTAVQWLSRPVTRAALLASAPHSVLGGGIAGMPSPGKIAFIGGSIGFIVTAIGLLFYLYALGVVARAIDADARTGIRKPTLHSGMPDGLWPAWLRICGLALVYVLFTGLLISAVLIPRAVHAGFKPASLQWLVAAVVLPMVALVLYVSIGTLRAYVLRVQELPVRVCNDRPVAVSAGTGIHLSGRGTQHKMDVPLDGVFDAMLGDNVLIPRLAHAAT